MEVIETLEIVVEAKVDAEQEDAAEEVQVQAVGDPVHLGELGYRLGIAKVWLKSIRTFTRSGECSIICL